MVEGLSWNVLDLFSGIGGFSLGLERAGMRTVAFCEIEPSACAVLRKHWPDVPIIGDIRAAAFPEADVICGGFPCQDVSYAGKRAGVAGERSGLFWEMVRAVRLVRPRYVIVENVAALSTDGMDAVLGTMAAERYDAEWDCISASDCGAPHGRPRVWIAFADADCKQRPQGSRSGFRRRQWKPEENAEVVPHPNSERKLELFGLFGEVRRRIADGAARSFWERDWQAKFEALRGMDDGVPTRLDRIRDGRSIARLGNAVIPQIPQLIGEAIMAYERDNPCP
jgi:DNA (cytosine-5)-methyltransferase 1